MIGVVFAQSAPKLLAGGMLGAAAFLRPAIERDLRHQAAQLLTLIMAKASGRPGPRVQTGDYRRSWTAQPLAAPNYIAWFVGTNAPQGPRLEYGFVGQDSLGRHYNQPPFPHVGPAVAVAEKQFHRSFEVIIQSAMNKVP